MALIYRGSLVAFAIGRAVKKGGLAAKNRTKASQ